MNDKKTQKAMRSEIVNLIAELRPSLTVINGYALIVQKNLQLTSTEEISAENTHALNTIIEQVEFISRLINNIEDETTRSWE